MAITSTGLGSGLDIEGIITKLMTVEAQPLQALAKKEASYQAKLTAYGTFSGAVSAFRSASSAISGTSSVNTATASSSDSSTLTASASSISTAGTYSVNVTQLAKAQQLVAAGQTSLSASIGTGVLTFDFGTISGGAFNPGTGQYTGSTFTSNGSGVKTVTISAANDSLTGIRDAVNAANIGVTATIINDGSGTPYRLAFSSKNQGASNSLKVSVSGSPALDNLLGNDPGGTQHLQETVSAQDALLQINGVAVSSKSNAVSSAITGVTLNLLKTTSGTPTTVTVGKDTSAFTKQIDNFVKAYNDLNKTIKDLTAYDPKTRTGGLLVGDTVVRSVQSQIRATLTATVPGLTTGAYKSLSDVGISIQKDGTLATDSAKLSTALSANPTDVAALFASLGRPTDSLVKYVSSAGNTAVSSRALNITNIATQGTATGVAPVVSTTITAGVNDTLSVTVDGVTTSVVIAAGAYTQAGLNSAIQSAINGDASIAAAGGKVAVTDVGGIITITSSSYGSVSTAKVNGGNAAPNLFGAASILGTAGTDVAGTIGGATATGSGQYLTTSDNLKIQVEGGATGARGTVEFARGYGYLLDTLASGYFGSKGTITSKTDGINTSIDKITEQRATLNKRLVAIEKRYRAQFSALDATVSSLNNTSAYLTQQLTALTKATKSGN